MNSQTEIDRSKSPDGSSARGESNGSTGELLNSQSLEFIEALYDDFRRDPRSVPVNWRPIFNEWAGGDDGPNGGVGVRVRPAFKRRSIFNPPSIADGVVFGDGEATDGRLPDSVLQERVDQLIRNFRVRGHITADIDPLDRPRPDPPELYPELYGITEADYDRPLATSNLFGCQDRTVGGVIRQLRNTYCRNIGVQYMHIDSLIARSWLQERMESTENHIHLDREQQLRIFRRLSDAVVFEDFLQTKFLGAKSFSLEGAESLIPLLDLAIEKAGNMGVEEIVLGMAHRGRLNVLANIMGKSPRAIFREFEDVDPQRHIGSGDVKYHLGYSADWKTHSGRKVHLSLCFNPSHLEYVNTVVLGRVRAKQNRFGDQKRRKGMALLIHGDAAFAGEGVVQETLNLSELADYSVGGTIHVVVNNQIGFTTSPVDGRSCAYATDVAKMLQSPIFHVNGEDPEAVAQVIHLALEFREKFQRDVVIDMYCFRLRGHNEGDEPSFTQPVMYEAVRAHPSVRRGYRDRLLDLGEIREREAEQIAEERRNQLDEELTAARSDDYLHSDEEIRGVWKGRFGGSVEHADHPDTAVDKKRLSSLLYRLTDFPDDFNPHPKIERGLKRRRKMAEDEVPLDWSIGEALAFASLATDGVSIRITGQDSQRGTFSQRHGVLHDYKNGREFEPFNALADDQAHVEIANSPLSEAGVLGFEYGYSLDTPTGLTLWEAQFGDFVNAGQVVIDQFIASAEDKWNRLSGLTMLLPHGYEGQGPEHSSARLERFLMLAAEDNIQVVYPSTPAQYFHLLRRQAMRKWTKPLIVMTPKSLLRHKRAVSTLDDCANGRFQEVLPDAEPPDAENVNRILLCTGKVYYDLEEAREEHDRSDVAIHRVEQLYPLPEDELRSVLEPCRDGVEVVWVQEEPENMGAWRFLAVHLGGVMFDRFPFTCIARAASSSPATGSSAAHKYEQQELLDRAFEEA